MQNKGAIKFFAIAFALVCLYQLSFTYFAKRVENKANQYAYNETTLNLAKELAKGDKLKEQFYTDSIGIARESTFLVTDKKNIDRRPFLLVFLFFACLSVWFTWGGWFSVLPATASLLSVISFWQQKPRVSRLLALPISACMITYSIAVGSYAGIANEVFTISSTVIGIVRHDLKKQNK